MSTTTAQFPWFSLHDAENPYKVMADFKNDKGVLSRTSRRFPTKIEAFSFFENNTGFCLISKTNVAKNKSDIIKYRFK